MEDGEVVTMRKIMLVFMGIIGIYLNIMFIRAGKSADKGGTEQNPF